MPLRLADGRSTVVTLRELKRGLVTVTASGSLRGAVVRDELTLRVRRILHLDADYSAFYTLAALDPELALGHARGRPFRSQRDRVRRRREDDLHDELRLVRDDPDDGRTRHGAG